MYAVGNIPALCSKTRQMAQRLRLPERTEGRSMLKKLVQSLLSVILFVTAACAADHGAAELPALSEEPPLAVVCTGSGVLLRAEPDKNSRKISSLAKNETVYAIGVKNSG